MSTNLATSKEVKLAKHTAVQRVPKSTLIVRRFCRNTPAVLGFAIFMLLALLAIAGPYLSKYRYDDLDFLALKQPPTAAHWLGTDIVGADMLALCMRGLGRSLMIGVIASLGITVIAAFVGTAVAYFEGWREKVGVWIIDMMLVIPTFFLLAIMVKGATGTNGWLWLTAALTIFGWVGYARILRSIALSLREREYVAAARFMGVPSFTILRRHMIPNLGSILIIQTVLGVVYAVQAETGLSFLGFGIAPPDTSLGVLIRAGSGTLLTAPWMFLEPAALLLLLCFSMTLIGDGLRDALDPSSASGGRA
ncbi:MAG TPA: ABC transporter permease [Gammaproteobacteria bacterium]|nr:ABC transporter permease [Gammaproteobacteria bacterium]